MFEPELKPRTRCLRPIGQATSPPRLSYANNIQMNDTVVLYFLFFDTF